MNVIQGEGVKADRFELNIRGLKVWYRSDKGKTTISYDAFATCNLFQELSWIEAFDTDGQEPIILHEDANVKPYSHIHWCDFVESFDFDLAKAQKVSEHHYAKNNLSSTKSKQQDKLLIREVTPPLHLYHLHNYYYEHIRTRKKD